MVIAGASKEIGQVRASGHGDWERERSREKEEQGDSDTRSEEHTSELQSLA